MNKDALVTGMDVDGLNVEIQSKHLYRTVRDFLEGEPNLSYIMGVRLGLLNDALERAGVKEEHRKEIVETMNLTLGINIYLMHNATRRLIDGLLPTVERDGEP